MSYLITGSSSSLAKSISELLIAKQREIKLYTRNVDLYSPENKNVLMTEDYRDLIIEKNTTKLLICNGSFDYSEFSTMKIDQIEKLIEANFSVVLVIISQFLQQSNKDLRRDIFILGSSAIYDLGENVSVYASCKKALQAFVKILNKEFTNSETRFSLISTGTINNMMGRQVPGQLPETLLNEDVIASEIVDLMEQEGNFFQPEVLLRRRNTQAH